MNSTRTVSLALALATIGGVALLNAKAKGDCLFSCPGAVSPSTIGSRWYKCGNQDASLPLGRYTCCVEAIETTTTCVAATPHDSSLDRDVFVDPGNVQNGHGCVLAGMMGDRAKSAR